MGNPIPWCQICFTKCTSEIRANSLTILHVQIFSIILKNCNLFDMERKSYFIVDYESSSVSISVYESHEGTFQSGR